MVRSTDFLTVPRVLASLRARVLAVYVVALVPALAMAALQPVWSRVDEAQHADVLAQYAHGTMPTEGVTTLRPEIVAVDEATGIYRWYPPGSGPPPAEADPQAFVRPPQNASAEAKQAWMARHLWGFSYEAMQPPLYYLLAEPDWVLGSQFGGTLGAIYAARLFSALIAACLAPLAYLLALTIRPEAQRMHLFAAGIAALLPGYVLNATQITNDGLAAVLGAALTVVAVKGARDGWTRSLAAACGVLLGAAVMTKLTTVGLAPLVAAAFLWPGAQRFRSRLAFGAMAATIATVIVAPWLLFDMHTYGQPIPSRATHELLGSVFTPPSASMRYLRASARQVVDEFVAGEPFAIIPLTRLLVWFAEAVGVLAAIGLGISVKRLRLEWLLLVGVAADFVWVVGTPYLSGIGGLMTGRYLFPAAAAAVVLVAAGIEALPALLARAIAGAGGALAILSLALLVTTQFGLVVQHHEAPAPGGGVALVAKTQAAGFRVVADRAAVTDGGHTLWVHVTVTDLAQRPADFQPLPDAVAVGVGRIYGDYGGGTPFKERLQPGESESGWLRFTRTDGPRLTQVQLDYRNVSTDGYATIETLSLVVAP